jgi:cytochrome c oxidase subunit III
MTDAAMRASLPVGAVDQKALGWYGLLTLIVTEGALFGYLLFAYFYCAVQFPPAWSPEPHPPLTFAIPSTVAMLLGSGVLWWGQAGLRNRSMEQHRAGLAFAMVFGVIYLVLQSLEWASKPFSFSSNLYSSLYFTITGFDMAHILVGVIGLAVVLIWSALGYVDNRRNTPVEIVSAYWYFVTAVWVAVFISLYISPYWR